MITLIIDCDYSDFLRQLNDYGFGYTEMELNKIVTERENTRNNYLWYGLQHRYFYAFFDEDNKCLIKLPYLISEVENPQYTMINYFSSDYRYNKNPYYDLIRNINYVKEMGQLRINTINNTFSLLLKYLFHMDEVKERTGIFKLDCMKRARYDFGYLRHETNIKNIILEKYDENYLKELFNLDVIKEYLDDMTQVINNKNFIFDRYDSRYGLFSNYLTDLFYIEEKDFLSDELFIQLIDELKDSAVYYKNNTTGFSLYVQGLVVNENFSKEKIKKYVNFLFEVEALANNKGNNYSSLENLEKTHDLLTYSEIELLPAFKKFKTNITRFITRNKNDRVLKTVYRSIPELIDWSKEDENMLKEAFPKGMKVGNFEFKPKEKVINIDNYPSTILSDKYPSLNNLILAFSYIIYGNSADYIDEMAAAMFNILNNCYYNDFKNSFREAIYVVTNNKYEITSENFINFINKVYEKVDETNSVTIYRKYLDMLKNSNLINILKANNFSDKFKSTLMEYKLKK